MPALKILPSNVANMIAAGEVVQRPASVVKELMENAVDAGAHNISVIITDAGRTLIQVIDDGCGMSPDEAQLCFERHATSKIASPEDLNAILTYGFRGEALPSIAAVSEVTLRSRRAEDEVATEVVFCESQLRSTAAVSAPLGSNFAVRNLFFNVPARRKFLKSDTVEFKHIVEEFTRVALTRPDLAFSLIHGGRDIFVLKKAKSLKFRIMDILGSTVADDIVEIHTQTSLVQVDGYIGRPDGARKALGNQFFFVNGRFFRSPYLHKAVMKAYEEFVPEGLTPSYFIFLTTDPAAIDVNIHPTKTEIKFEEDSLVFQILFASVRETLGRNSFGASIDFDTDGTVSLPVIGSKFDEYRPGNDYKVQVDESFNPFSDLGPGEGFELPRFDSPAGAPEHRETHAEPRQDTSALFQDRTMPSAQVIIVQQRYIITQARSGLMAVHIRRAYERILYERFLNALGSGAHVTQTALFPVQVKVGVQNRLLFDSQAEMLASLGFDISPFGTDTVVVNGVPEGYSCESGKVEKMVDDLLLVLSEDHTSLESSMQSALASKFALLGATSAQGVSSAFEAQRLIDALFACENAEFTPGGRKILSIIPIEEIDRKF